MKKLGMLLVSCSLVMSSGALSGKEKRLDLHELYWTHNQVWGNLNDWANSYNDVSRKIVRSYIAKKRYKSVLAIPCGPAPEYYGFKADNIEIDYRGVDITQHLVEFAVARGINAKQGSIERIPYADRSMDVCYARHIMEHLSYYKQAFDELIRVAKKEVVVVFFIAPGEAPDDIKWTSARSSMLYNNYYNKHDIEQYVRAHERVIALAWEKVEKGTASGDELVLHIYLK